MSSCIAAFSLPQILLCVIPHACGQRDRLFSTNSQVRILLWRVLQGELSGDLFPLFSQHQVLKHRAEL